MAFPAQPGREIPSFRVQERSGCAITLNKFQGVGTLHSGSFGSSNTKIFDLEGAGIRTATMSGTYAPKNNFRGTIAYFNGDTESFTTTYDADSESAQNLNLVAGNYAGLRADNHTVTVTVESAGTFQDSHQMDASLLEHCLLVQRTMCFIMR